MRGAVAFAMMIVASAAQAQTPPSVAPATPAAIDVARRILHDDGTADAIAAAIGAKRAADIKTVGKLFNMSAERATLFVDTYWIPEMRRRLADFLDVGAQIYASRLSAADLQAADDFLHSAAGQKMIAARSEVAREFTTGERAWQHAVLVDAVKKFNHDTAQPNAQ